MWDSDGNYRKAALEEEVELLLVLLDWEFPDPVDVFEDQLAHRLGFRRHPGISDEEWRRARVRFIDAADSTDDLSEAMAQLDL